MADIKIYQFSGSGFAWRLLLACIVKDVAFEIVPMRPTQEALKAPEFLRISPRGKVPVLQDGDFTVVESMAAIAYLDRKVGGPSLFGETPEDHGRIWRRVLDFDLYVSGRMLNSIIVPILFGRTAAAAAEIKDAALFVHDELAPLEKDLGDRAWLEGDRISAADIAVYPLVEVLLRFASKPDAMALDLGFDTFAERYPTLQRWRRAVQVLPRYETTYPEYWRQVDEGGA